MKHCFVEKTKLLIYLCLKRMILECETQIVLY